MGIDGINDQRGALPVDSKSGSAQGTKARPAAQPTENADRVDFSDQTLEFIRVRQLADSTPEVRQDRVDQLRREVEGGTYKVSADDIADSILRENRIDFTA